MLRRVILAVSAALFVLAPQSLAGNLKVTGLQTEYQECPLGLDTKSPCFNWKLDSDGKNVLQTAYELDVSTDESFSRIVYSSGKVLSGVSVGIPYKGGELLARTRYFWKVKVWDNRGRSAVSAPSFFETGLLDEGWSGARWIGSEHPHFSRYRGSFVIDFDMEVDDGGTGTFVMGATDDYAFIPKHGNQKSYAPGKAPLRYVLFELGNDGKLTVSHVKDGVKTKDHSLDAGAGSGSVRHLKLDVVATDYSKAYEVKISVDGKLLANPAAPKAFADRYEVRFDEDSEWQPFCRFNMIGAFQTDGSSVTISNLTVRNKVWDIELYRLNGTFTATTADALKLFSPSDELSAPVLSNSLAVDGELESARLYTTACGIYEYSINGERVGDDWFNPGSTDFRYRMFYSTYDITPLLKQGRNEIMALLGSGWYSDYAGFSTSWQDQFGLQLSLLAKIVLRYADGRECVVVSDGSWKVCDEGPVINESLVNGEDYDARKSIREARWKDVTVYPAPSYPGQTESPRIVSYVGSGIRPQMILGAVSVSEPQPGIFVYDMGQNMVGVPSIKLTEGLKTGQRITLKYGEMVYPETIPENPVAPLTVEDYVRNAGRVYNQNYRGALSTDHYIVGNNPSEETIQPHLTFHGYRYVEIHGLEEPLPLENVKGIVLNSVGRQTSGFETSDARINRLYENIVWGERGNFLSIPTDCPQRDERMGWTGDAQVFCRASSYNMNVDPFFRRWFQSILDAQAEDGSIGDYIPKIGVPPAGSRKGGHAVGWMEAFTVIPWQMYQQYGDIRFLEDNWDGMVRYVEFLKNRAPLFIQPDGGYGDWLAVEKPGRPLTNTAYFAYDALLMKKMASALGKKDAEQYYADLYEDIKKAFNAEPSFRFDTQTANVLALYFGLFDGKRREEAVDFLVNDIKAHGNTLTTGFIGTPYINMVLSDTGNADMAYTLFEQTAYPSWLYPVLQGATTIWERWNSYTIKDGFGDVEMNSFNHYSYGSIQEWMFSYCLGIQRDEKSPGYRHFILQPQPGGHLDYVKGWFDSQYGRIEVGWRRIGNKVVYDFTVPSNTSATLRVKGLPEAELGSGHHRFSVRNR